MARTRASNVAAAEKAGNAAEGAAAASSLASKSSALTRHARPDSEGVERKTQQLHRLAVTNLLGPIRFALMVVSSFALSVLGDAFMDFLTRGEMASIARRPESRIESSLLAAWKM